MRNQRSWRILTEVDENTSTLKVSKVIGKVDSNGDSFYPTFTDPTTVVFMSDDKKVFETCKATADGAGNLTLTKRGLSDDKSETEVSTFKKDWLPGTYMYATMGAGDLPSLNEDNTWNGEQNFEGNVNIGGELNVEGDFNMNSDGDVDITTENGTVIFQDKDVGPVTLAQMIHQTGDGTEVLIMSESAYQALDTPTVNTLYLTHYNGTKITKAHLNGINYKISDEDIHDLTENSAMNDNDEIMIADSGNSYASKKVKRSTLQKFNNLTEKTNLIGADEFLIGDSEASYSAKRIKFKNMLPTFVFGDGSDGECIITQDTTMCAKEYNFTNFKICSGAKVCFCGEGIPVIRARCCIDNQGVIDLKSRNISCSVCELMYGVGGICKLGTTPYSEPTISQCGGSGISCGSICSGKGGGPGENGEDGSGTCYGLGGTGAECAGGGGGGAGSFGASNGCNATACYGGKGGGGCYNGQGGGGGYGYIKGGDGGDNIGTCSSCGGNGGNGYCCGGKGGNGCTCGGNGGDAYYYGGDGGCGCSTKGGNGGKGVYCKGGKGGWSNLLGGNGGDSYLGCGGDGGGSSNSNGGNGGYGYIKGGDGGHGNKCGGNGGDSYLQGGNGGGASCFNGGNGGNSKMGMYGIGLIGCNVSNNCITGFGGNGGSGGIKGSCSGAVGGNGGNGGNGADVMIVYANCITAGCIENYGGCGGNSGACGVKGTDGKDGLCAIIHFSN